MRAKSWLSLVSCPECEMPAEVTDLFSLHSTEGPADHVALACIAGHYFRMALDRLPADAQLQLSDPRAGLLLSESLSAGSSGVSCSRLPGTLGSVGYPVSYPVGNQTSPARKQAEASSRVSS
jgi:hypothetical protein